ncbi:MAG TPA: CRTAC1 family protein [Candidatus Polarisedimenticolia bacterium]|nr:CRTAC1 family protein [Candidatus Polarisedimenticolia bacterium]
MSACFLLLSSALSAAPLFTDATPASGLAEAAQVCGGPAKDYIVETIGLGAAALDFDNDGDVDLYLPNGSTLEGFPPGKEPRPRLMRNNGRGAFEDVTAGSGLGEPFWGSGTAVGDYDNDGLTDLYVTAYGPNRLYRNLGGGRFADVSAASGVGDARWGASASFADFDNDGRLDLFVANYVAFDTATVPRRGDPDRPCYYRGAMVMCGPTGLKGDVDVLYRNNGDGTFTDVTASAGLRTDIGLFGLGAAAADYDRDGDIDLYVANDATPNELYRNRGDGTFEDVAAVSGVAYGIDGIEAGSMGTSFGDYDGDGALDLVVTNFSHQSYQLFRQVGEGYFEDVTYATGIYELTFLMLGWATEFFDFDHDGWLDLYFGNGHVYAGVEGMEIGTTYRQPSQLLRNVAAPGGGRTFQDVTASAGPAFTTPRSHRGGGVFDADGDGDLDLLLTVMDGAPVLLRNEAGSSSGAWIELRLAGRKANRSGAGARVAVTAGGRTMVRSAGGGGSYLWSSEPNVHFGLGPARSVDRVEVIWPGGGRQSFQGLAAGRSYTLIEGESPVPAAASAGAR